jgi:spermidine/putrescine transport system substrate-binding protein
MQRQLRSSLFLASLLLNSCTGTPVTLEDQAATNIAVVNATQNTSATLTAASQTEPVSQADATPAANPLRLALEREYEWQCPVETSGATLRVANWFTYIDETTIPNFEQFCGITVDYVEYADSYEAAAFLRAEDNPFDVMILSDSDVLVFAQQGLLLPLNPALLPNISNLNPELLNRSFDPGNRYSYPYLWGTIGVGYNTVAVEGTITSWTQVFGRTDLRIGWMNSPREMLGIALRFLGLDPNTQDPADLSRARDYLISHSENVSLVDDENGQTLLASGELDIVIEYSGDVFQIIDECNCQTFVYAVPEEGTPFALDTMAIPVGASHPALAHAFLDYLMIPRIAASIADYTAYASPNQAAINRGLIDPVLLNNAGIYPGDLAQQNLFIILSTPDLETLYETYWEQVVAVIG